MLVTTIEEVQKYVPANVTSEFRQVESFVAAAERTYIYPVLGRKLYNKLVEQYETTFPEPLTDEWQELLDLVQYPLINFTVYKALPKNNVTIMTGGAAVVSNQNMEVASQKRVDELRASLFEDAHEGIDQLLIFLEEDALSAHPQFAADWKDSKYYYHVQGSLINTAHVFNEYVNIDGSRARFVQLKPDIAFSEKVYIRPEIGNELVNYLIDNDGKLDEPHTLLQNQLRNALAYYAADRDRELHTDYYRTNAKLLLTEARNEVFAHPEKYPAFRNSSLYQPKTDEEKADGWKNGKDKRLFVMRPTTQN